MGEDNKELRASIIIGGIQILLAFIQIFTEHNMIYSVLITSLSGVLLILLILYILKYKKLAYDYTLIQYLFHNHGRNQFNSLPKMLLLQKQQGRYNGVEIDKLKINWNMYPSQVPGWLHSIFEWEFGSITNISRENISEYLMYNTYDIAKSSKANLSFFIDDAMADYDLKFEESNKVRMLSFGLPKILKPKQRIDKFKIVLKSRDSLRIGRNDALCICPLNYGKKVKSIDIKINMGIPSPLYELELIEIGRIPGVKGISERSIERGVPKQREGGIRYRFSLDEEIMNMQNIYVILLKAR